MEPVFSIIMILMFVILGLLVFNYKIGLSNIQVAYVIGAIAFGSMILLAIMYDPHSECDLMINFNNIPLETVQNKCFTYIDL